MVQDKLWDARLRWNNLGLALGIDQTSLDEIAEKNRNRPDACFSDVLKMWLQGCGDSSRTWSTITAALRTRSISMGALAEEIN